MLSPVPLDHFPTEPAVVTRGAYDVLSPIGLAPPHHHVPREMPVPDEAQVEAELARIETMEMSDVDGPGFEAEKEDYLQRGRKRALDAEDMEVSKRKVSYTLINMISAY
jgi:DNA helicase INO80